MLEAGGTSSLRRESFIGRNRTPTVKIGEERTTTNSYSVGPDNNSNSNVNSFAATSLTSETDPSPVDTTSHASRSIEVGGTEIRAEANNNVELEKEKEREGVLFGAKKEKMVVEEIEVITPTLSTTQGPDGDRTMTSNRDSSLTRVTEEPESQASPSILSLSSSSLRGSGDVRSLSSSAAKEGSKRVSNDVMRSTNNVGDSYHSFHEEEKRAIVRHINSLLRNDPDLESLIPINPDSMDIFSYMKEGVLLWYLFVSI